MSFSAYLWTLFVSAFLSSTLLPGGSEALVIYGAERFSQHLIVVLSIASLGNILGAMTTYCIGRFLPNRVQSQVIQRFQKWGAVTLLFSWLPVVGDGFCLAAGWMRVSWSKALILIAVGKIARYLALAYGWLSIFG